MRPRTRTTFRNRAILADGHSLPTISPVYWTIWVLDKDTRKPYASRMSYHKVLSPREASQQCFGMEPTENMLFFNMGSHITDMRQMLKQIGQQWIEMGGE